jgi:hypothetical protein
MVDVMAAAQALGKLVNLGIALRNAGKRPSDLAGDMQALEALVDAGRALGSFRPPVPSSLMARHLALVARSFGEARRRHWADDARVLDAQEKEVTARMKLAAVDIARPGDGTPEKELDPVSALCGDPLRTPYYAALWRAFTNPEIAEGGSKALPLIDLVDPGARLQFERQFRLAYGEALATADGREVRDFLLTLAADRTEIVRQILVRDTSTWRRRHVFGNAEAHELLPPMPLEAMYVEPRAEVTSGPPSTSGPAPALELIGQLLARHDVVVVAADFGYGKSLTARTLAWQAAERYLETDQPSTERSLPVFVRCADDLVSRRVDLSSAIGRAMRRQARSLGIDLPADDPAFAPPPRDARVLYLLDGLDEVSLSERQVLELVDALRDRASERHRFVLLSRPAALPRREALGDVPVVRLLPLSPPQIDEWIDKWQRVTGAAGSSFSHAALEERGLADIAGTPILLFMIAHTWNEPLPEGGKPPSRAALYEAFFRRIARGKHELDRDQNQRIAEASVLLRDRLALDGEIPRTAEPPEAMLWLLGRVAWESRRLQGRGLPLGELDVRVLVREELGLHGGEVEATIRIGLLLALQADLDGDGGRILFGHKSFRDFLVARHWAGRLARLADGSPRAWELVERDLLGGRLMDEEDRSFALLLEILAGWEEAPRRRVQEWAEHTFNDERLAGEVLRDDQRTLLREAALALGCALADEGGVRARDRRTLRSLLAWFWLRNEKSPLILAPGIVSEEAVLADADLYAANLSHARLRGAVLVNADLGGSNLREADLQGADLTGANLRDADLRGADLRTANLQSARLDGARVDGARLDGAILAGVRGLARG